MDFKTLNESLPYVSGGKEHLLEYKPYADITLRFPGKHASDTEPVGGDFVVCVTDAKMGWRAHQFTHVDLFEDLQLKIIQGQFQTMMKKDAAQITHDLMQAYLEVIQGKDSHSVGHLDMTYLAGIRSSTFIRAVQCLAIAEHRRYHKFEGKFGGRFLPFRFASGIVEGKWTSKDATARHRKGRPGVEWLEKEFGIPQLTRELFNA